MSAGFQVAKPIPIRPGGFVQCVYPGHFTDPTTGIVVPGTRVTVDPITRRVLEVIELGTPVQVPHKKRITVYESQPGERDLVAVEREMDFNKPDDQDLTSGLFCALQCGIIINVDDEKMQRLYPETWAGRQENIVWSKEQQTEAPMADLLADAEAKIREARKRTETIKESGSKNNPPAPAS